MTTSVSVAMSAAGYSWTPAGKDRDGDNAVSREEFKLPVADGSCTLVPADFRSMPSLDEAFDAYDGNRDGKIDDAEASRHPIFPRHPADRFSANWAATMDPDQAEAYAEIVNRENAALAKSWGIDLML